MARTIILQSTPDVPIVEACRCSDCDWSFVMRCPEPYGISYDDAVQAWREFDDHRCEDFKRRIKGVQPRRTVNP